MKQKRPKEEWSDGVLRYAGLSRAREAARGKHHGEKFINPLHNVCCAEKVYFWKVGTGVQTKTVPCMR